MLPILPDSPRRPVNRALSPHVRADKNTLILYLKETIGTCANFVECRLPVYPFCGVDSVVTDHLGITAGAVLKNHSAGEERTKCLGRKVV